MGSFGKHVFRWEGRARAGAQGALEITYALSTVCDPIALSELSVVVSPKLRMLPYEVV
jgi:hypothetical protein